MSNRRVRVVWSALSLAGALTLASCGGVGDASSGEASSAWPSGTMELVIPTAPGSSSDRTVRKLAPLLEAELDENITVLNRPGGTGVVAMQYAQQKPADGSVWTLEGTGMPAVLAMTESGLEMSDFEPVGTIELDPFVLFVHPDNPANSLEEFVKMAKNDGEVSICGYGTGTPHHLSAAKILGAADVDYQWVTYDSGSNAVTDLIGKNLDAVLSNATQIQAFGDELKPLAHSSEEALPYASNLPSFADEGYDGVTPYHWRGVLAKSGTPEDILDGMHDALAAAVATQDFQSYLEKTGSLDGTMPREEMQSRLETQTTNDVEQLTNLGLLDD